MLRTLVLTLLALLAFAGNSILCRLALKDQSIDPVSFTSFRLISGMLVLVLLVYTKDRQHGLKSCRQAGSGVAAGLLFIYALAFSAAYTLLDTGTGALILFGMVQVTMTLSGVRQSRRLSGGEFTGLVLAFGGLVYLLLPGATAPPLAGFLLMSTAGIAWAVYTLLGRRSTAALSDTAGNFLNTMPLVAGLLLTAAALQPEHFHLSATGLLWAIVSGAITSGIGYALWYAALAGLSATEGAVVQLLVPIIASAGGVLLIGESIDERLLIASALTLGGILQVFTARARQPQV